MTASPRPCRRFFTDRLAAQRHASAHTVAAYRDSLRLLLALRCTTAPASSPASWTSPTSTRHHRRLPDHLEQRAGQQVRTRNARLAAIHSLFRYAALRHPEHAASIQRVLAIPPKRFDQSAGLLPHQRRGRGPARRPRPRHLARPTRPRPAVRCHPDRATRRRTDRAASHRRRPRTGPHVRVLGKGRKERCIPLTATTTTTLAAWLDERFGTPIEPVFPSRRGIPAEHGRHRGAGRQARDHGSQPLPITGRQDGDTPRAATHVRHAPAPVRHGHCHHRALARPCRHPLVPALPARRPRAQGTSTRTLGATTHDPWQIPTHRRTARLPRQPLTRRASGIMPTSATIPPCPPTDPGPRSA